MSTTYDAPVACPRCGERFNATLFTNLHVTRSPAVRDDILAGKFQRFDCPHCAASVRVEPSMLYTDFERYRWYAVFPQWAIEHRKELSEMVLEGFHRNMLVQCAPIVRSWAPMFRIRVIFGLPSLRDKLLCDDAELDDRVLEVFKLQLLRDRFPEAFRPDATLYLDRAEPLKLTFLLTLPGDQDDLEVVRRVAVDRTAYQALALSPGLAERMPDFFNSAVVDWRAPLQPDRPLPKDPLGEQRVRLPWQDPE